MQTLQTNRTINYKKGRKLSDLSIIAGFKNSPVWKLVFFKPKEALWTLLNQYIEANSVVLSYCYTSVVRCQHGSLVCGMMLTGMCCSFLLAFNSIHIWTPVAPMAALAVPALPFYNDTDELYRLAYSETHSKSLFFYGCAMTLSSNVHVIISWLGYSKNATQRGLSYSYLLIDRLLSKYVTVGQFFIHFLEALIVFGVGLYLWLEVIDPYFGWFVMLISGNEAITLLSEKSRQIHSKALINA